jgi:hypothetical protein
MKYQLHSIGVRSIGHGHENGLFTGVWDGEMGMREKPEAIRE